MRQISLAAPAFLSLLIASNPRTRSARPLARALGGVTPVRVLAWGRSPSAGLPTAPTHELHVETALTMWSLTNPDLPRCCQPRSSG
jgi:hypothetical protein